MPLGLDNKPESGTQASGTAVTQKQFPFKSARPGIRQMATYTHPNTRPPPKPPDSVDDRRDSRPKSAINPNFRL